MGADGLKVRTGSKLPSCRGGVVAVSADARGGSSDWVDICRKIRMALNDKSCILPNPKSKI
jgi:hypothetical protein